MASCLYRAHCVLVCQRLLQNQQWARWFFLPPLGQINLPRRNERRAAYNELAADQYQYDHLLFLSTCRHVCLAVHFKPPTKWNSLKTDGCAESQRNQFRRVHRRAKSAPANESFSRRIIQQQKCPRFQTARNQAENQFIIHQVQTPRGSDKMIQ